MFRKLGHVSKPLHWSISRRFSSQTGSIDSAKEKEKQKSDGKSSWKWTRRLGKLGCLVGLAGGQFYSTTRGTVFQPKEAPYIHQLDGKKPVDPDPFHRNKQFSENIFQCLRFVHTLSVLTSMLLDYSLAFSARELAQSLAEEKVWLDANGQFLHEFGVDDDTVRRFANLAYRSDRRKKQESELHERCAVKLLNLSVQNGGCYIKLAQHVANLGHGIPGEYVKVQSVLQDRAPPQPLSRMLNVLSDAYKLEIKEADIDEMGIVSGPLSALYTFIDPKPIAAASLAQVHRGITVDGETVAIKIQYEYLTKLMEGDLATVRACIKIAEMAFPRLDLAELGEEFAEGLRGEVNFVRESQHAEKSARLLHNLVDIPRPRWDQTSPRVMVSEFVKGVPIADTAAISASLVHPHAVARDLLSSFAHMLFVSGYVHCDPHPGNALVRVNAVVEREANPEKYNFQGRVPTEVVYGTVRTPFSMQSVVTWPLSLAVAHALLPLKLLMLGTSLAGEAIGYMLPSAGPPPPVEGEAQTTTYVFPNDTPDIVFSKAPPFSDPLLRFVDHTVSFQLYPLLAPSTSLNLVDWLMPPSYSKPDFSSSVQLQKPRVVLLDHGLYREFSTDFRKQFTTLFYSFFTRDDNAAKEAAIAIGMGEYWELQFLIFAHRPAFSSAAAGSNAMTKEEQLRLRKKFRTLDLQDIISTLSADLAFAMKTISLLRSVSAQLLFPRSERLAVFFHAALQGVYEIPNISNQLDASAMARVVTAAPYAVMSDYAITKEDSDLANFLHLLLQLKKKPAKQQTEHKYTLLNQVPSIPELTPASEQFLSVVGDNLVRQDPFSCKHLTQSQLEVLQAPNNLSHNQPVSSGLIRLDLRQASEMTTLNSIKFSVDKLRANLLFNLYEIFVANKGKKVIG